ncbi:hypothetical protein ARMSODRAFT_1024952 [Armillaria solidipes]|uniref:Uncharacterized protein n=1 Tax=Armillaria solidipes TaxID=1076256 RepID=A0A2H3AUE8_9AGAR|nr:hypothetical protein ARMSODRAFT_1024952 [Armillaria solidipes]
MVNEYFKLFYWALPLNQDPQPDDPLPVTDDGLSEAELEVKAAIIKQMSNAIPKWLDYHAMKTTASTMLMKKQLTRDPVALFLSHLNGLEGPQMQSLTPKQLFGKENDDINRRFDMFWGTQPPVVLGNCLRP